MLLSLHLYYPREDERLRQEPPRLEATLRQKKGSVSVMNLSLLHWVAEKEARMELVNERVLSRLPIVLICRQSRDLTMVCEAKWSACLVVRKTTR